MVMILEGWPVEYGYTRVMVRVTVVVKSQVVGPAKLVVTYAHQGG